jgi:predicted metal-dependent enzyme (double-stranded beta helix superfamily)
MFYIEEFVAACLAARTEANPILAIKEVLERAVSRSGDVAAAVAADPGVAVLHRSPELTIASVVVPAGVPASLPHDHRMWALVGIYRGQEDNQFFRRTSTGIEESGGRSLHVSDTLAMGDDTIHAITNPQRHSVLAALHVYGGDLLATPRSMWTGSEYTEAPYDERKVLGSPIRH